MLESFQTGLIGALGPALLVMFFSLGVSWLWNMFVDIIRSRG